MEMDGLIPWEACVRLMEPHWPSGARRTEQMLRMFLLQIWFRLPDDAVQDEICDSCAMTAFMRLDFAAGEQVPSAAAAGTRGQKGRQRNRHRGCRRRSI